jgi:hypothetical protein
VPNQLVGAPLVTDVTLICNVEASPKAINYWQRENGKIMNRKIFNFSFFYRPIEAFFSVFDFSFSIYLDLLAVHDKLKLFFCSQF